MVPSRDVPSTRPLSRPAAGTEHLLEMQVLTLIDDIEDEIGMVRAHAVDDRGEVGRAVHHRAIRLREDERRHLVLVVRFTTARRARFLVSAMPRLHVVDHRLDQVVTSASPFHRSNCTPSAEIRRMAAIETSTSGATRPDSRAGLPAAPP
jgi:hypothetical protein